MQVPPIHRYAPLVEGLHGLYYFVEGEDLAFRVRRALQNRRHLVEMGLSARQHVLQKHTLEALSRYVIQETQASLASRETALSFHPEKTHHHALSKT
jgi:hypothetical protein